MPLARRQIHAATGWLCVRPANAWHWLDLVRQATATSPPRRFTRKQAAQRCRCRWRPIYNTLHQFTEVGLLRQVAVDGSKAYFRHQRFCLIITSSSKARTSCSISRAPKCWSARRLCRRKATKSRASTWSCGCAARSSYRHPRIGKPRQVCGFSFLTSHTACRPAEMVRSQPKHFAAGRLTLGDARRPEMTKIAVFSEIATRRATRPAPACWTR